MILSFSRESDDEEKLICQYTISLKINLAHFQIAMNFGFLSKAFDVRYRQIIRLNKIYRLPHVSLMLLMRL
jgi:hypothetical protein